MHRKSSNQLLPLKIIFTSTHDYRDVNAFSTTIYYMARALKEELEDIEFIRFPRIFLHWKLMRFVRRLVPSFDISNNLHFLHICAWKIAKKYKSRRVLIINVVDAALSIYLSKKLPVINISDATYALLEETYYGTYGDISKSAAQFNHQAERAAIHSTHACFSSEWARDSAIRDYDGEPEKLSVIPWGCNLPSAKLSEARLQGDDARCRLLFVAAQWKRKGGDVVLDVARILQDRGIPVSLDLVGVEPESEFPKDVDIVYHGRLSKDDPAQLAKLLTLYRNSTFFILPTKQDCTPMVFAEANMFGTPAITCAVGGVAYVVRDGENGVVLPSTSSAESYVNEILKLWNDRGRYEALRRSSRQAYEERLNWRVWARDVVRLVRRLEASGEF